MRIIGNRGNTARKVQAVASGALASGDTVVVNSDGTVSVVAETSVSDALGGDTVFESADSEYISVAYDEAAGKIVIAYRDTGNSLRGTAVVGTVSGTSISFGTPVLFVSSGNTQLTSLVYNSSSQKIVIAYKDGGNSGYGTAIVGTVSGTSISFGTSAVFNSGVVANNTALADIPDAGKVVIVYSNEPSSYAGTARVGTVSGTSISFGTAAVFESVDARSLSIAYDTVAQKVAISYEDYPNSRYGTTVVGTVSGTSISFGTPVVFASGTTTGMDSTYDPVNQKIVMVCRDGTFTNRITARVGTISGTTISFGTSALASSNIASSPAIAYNAAAGKVIVSNTNGTVGGLTEYSVGTVSGTSITFTGYTTVANPANYSRLAYDSNSKTVVIAYQDDGNSNYGTANVIQTAYTTTNLTSENYIGIASNGYASGQAATINVKGFIDDNQSSLTAGQSYYVQTDGTLGLTADDPSVFAGTAVSATKLIVKG